MSAGRTARLGWWGIAAMASVFASTLVLAAGARAGAPLDLRSLDGAAVRNAAGDLAVQAGSHPYADSATLRLGAVRNPATGVSETDNNLKDAVVRLPPGLVGNPNVVPRCPQAQFGASEAGLRCPDNTSVGVISVQFLNSRVESFPIFNLAPPPGTPALFGTIVIADPVYISTSVRTGGDYGLNLELANVNQGIALEAATVTLWGDPFDPSHDEERGRCVEFFYAGPPCSVADVQNDRRAFITLPTSCQGPTLTSIFANSWQEPAITRSASFLSHDSAGNAASITGCDQVPFDPSVTFSVDGDTGDSPTGLALDLHVPQQESPNGVATSHLRTTTVTLPPGLVVNPSAANGLAGCSPGQIDLGGAGAPACPDASKIGAVEIDTPLIDHPLPGTVYLATPRQNPFGSLLALYLGVVDPQTGVVIKLPGRVDADPATGRLTATFADAPQLPFEDLRLRLFGGANAALRTPAPCGAYAVGAQLSPWSGLPAAARSAGFGIAYGAGGGPCAASEGALPNAPAFEAGTEAPLAGAYSPFFLKLKRADGFQNFGAIDATLPAGLLARLDGIPYCSETALAAAGGTSGAAQTAGPSCPAASRVGSATVGAGAGPSQFYASGQVYLAGPYKGAPLSLAIVTPALAGPFDLGTVVVRAALQVDPTTTQVRAVSDPIPSILEGIPLDLRSIVVQLDRPNFTLNPTSCDATAVTGTSLSSLGQSAVLRSPFQVGGCRDLDFAPKLALKLKGKTRRGANPQLTATLTPRKGDANIARAAVTLPRSEFLAQDHIKTVCTRVQYAADNCPKASIYGYAEAESPLLGKPLKGPVYLRSSSDKLPNLVAALRGQISIDLVGRIDSVKGGIRTVFATVPDAPVSKFTLRLAGGKRGLLVNSQDVCAAKKRAAVSFRAHSGALATSRPVLAAKCRRK